MTTPDTSAVRAWARDNGFVVAGRGRLPAEVVDAYTASRTKGTPAKRSGATTPPPASAVQPTTPAPAGAAQPRKPRTTRPPAKKGAPVERARAAKAAQPATRSRHAARKTATPTTGQPAALAPAVDPVEAFADASLDAISAEPPAPDAPHHSELQRLTERVHELAARVAALEARAGTQPDRPAKGLFRRQR